MKKTICTIQGHPHDDPSHLCHALLDAYEEGARSAGHEINRIDLASLDFDMLRNPRDFELPPAAPIQEAQEKVKSADHMVIIYPIWLGSMPALVKAFFEQLARNAFAIAQNEKGGWPHQMLAGKSARVIVTMGMPSAAYKLLFGAHGVKSFETAILGISGFKPVRDTLIGGVDGLSEKQVQRHFATMRELGSKAD
ncbi:MAG: NAD(P)H-dependent oxidoreductase [Pseudomonadota bacterium]